MSANLVPRWDLSNVYPGLESPEFEAGFNKIMQQLDDIDAFLTSKLPPASPQADAHILANVAGELIERFNETSRLARTLRAYITSFVSTDSFNKVAMRKLSEFEQVGVRLHKQQILVQQWIGSLQARLDEIIPLNPTTQTHAFFLKETAEQSRYMMSGAEEALAAELSLSGGNAWGKLQGTVTSQISVDFELDGETRKISMPALINLHSHADENVRQRAYQVEMATWKQYKEILAATLNGVKGWVNTLDQRRGRADALHSAIDDARIDRETLETMLGVMHDSFPMLRRYLLAKAARLGKQKLAWWDVFAPSGQMERKYTFGEAQAFILEHFGQFSPDLADFARRAFTSQWIDAEQRIGKRGGAFCMGVPGVEESRILCNFDHSLDQIFTIAHELGHGFHNDCRYKAHKSELQSDTPMTLAETASIMCETIVTNAALANAASEDEELAILETALISDTQVIVDIYSRYLFEKEVFERRLKSELSADELGEIMENAQKATYGEALDERYLHKYMWTWKSHYYRTGLSFYNFPYAFGLLFGLGLYTIYQQQGAAFITEYKNLLASTGEGRAADLAARFGIDLHKPEFWEASFKVLAGRVERYIQL